MLRGLWLHDLDPHQSPGADLWELLWESQGPGHLEGMQELEVH